MSLPSSTVGRKDCMCRTSGSLGSRGGVGCASCIGFDRFGSSPALSALAMRRAWNLAYFDFAAISGCRGFCHMLSRSRKVAAAWYVSTVCLSLHQHLTQGLIVERNARFGLIRSHRLLSSFECVQGKLLDVCLGSHIIMDGIISRVLRLPPLQFVHEGRSVCHALIALGVQSFLQDPLDNVIIAFKIS